MYSLQVRSIVVNIYRHLQSLSKTSLLVGIARSTIHRWSIDINRKMYPQRQCKVSNPQVQHVIVEFLNKNSLVTLRDVQEHIHKTCNVQVSMELVRLCLTKTLNMSNQKPRLFPITSKTQQEERTRTFLANFVDLVHNKCTGVVAIDEVGFSNNVCPLKGWNKRNHKYAIFKKLSSDKQHISCCCSVNEEGQISVMTKRGYFNKETFLLFLQRQIYPTKTLILLDNVKFHHSKEVHDLCTQKNWILLHIPPYSPWFNPIENVFSIVKNHFRKSRDIYKAFQSVSKSSITNIFKSLYQRTNLYKKNTTLDFTQYVL